MIIWLFRWDWDIIFANSFFLHPFSEWALVKIIFHFQIVQLNEAAVKLITLFDIARSWGRKSLMTQVQKNILNRLILRKKFLMMALALAARSTLGSGRHFIEYFLFGFFLFLFKCFAMLDNKCIVVNVFDLAPGHSPSLSFSGSFFSLFCFLYSFIFFIWLLKVWWRRISLSANSRRQFLCHDSFNPNRKNVRFVLKMIF